MACTPATIHDARRAAEALWREGVGRVLVFGSVARGEVRRFSDIDLVAVLASADDLGYDICHGRLQDRLSRAAEKTVEHLVDLVATDAPTWAARSRLRFTLESAIAADAIELFDRLDPAEIDWDKPTELPLTPLGEAHRRHDTPDDDRGSARTAGRAEAAVHSATKVIHVHQLHAMPPHTRDTHQLIEALPEPERAPWQRLGATTLIDPDDADAASANAAARTALAITEHVAERLEAAGAEPDTLQACRSTARQLADVLELA